MVRYACNQPLVKLNIEYYLPAGYGGPLFMILTSQE